MDSPQPSQNVRQAHPSALNAPAGLRTVRTGIPRPGTGGLVVGAVFLIHLAASLAGTSDVQTWPDRARAKTAALSLCLIVLAVARAASWYLARVGRPADIVARPRWRCSPRVFLFLAPAVFVTWVLAISAKVALLHGDRAAPTYNDLPGSPSGSVLLAAFVATVLVAPVLEELVYRGCLQSWLRRRLGAAAAIGIATSVFVLWHTGSPLGYRIPDLAGVAIAGLLYGILFERTALWPSIAAHAAFNGAWLLNVATGAPVFWLLGTPAAVVAVAAGAAQLRSGKALTPATDRHSCAQSRRP